MEPLKDSGQNVYPAFEGWYQNQRRLLHAVDWLLQSQQETDARHSDWTGEPHRARRPRPGSADALRGRPRLGHHRDQGPKDFGDKKLNWTLTANGKTVTHLRLHQGLSDRALQRRGDGEQAADDQAFEAGEGSHRTASAAVAGTRVTGVGGDAGSADVLDYRRWP